MNKDLLEKIADEIMKNPELAIAMVAGVKTETSYDSEREVFKVRTKNPVSIIKINGKYEVRELGQENGLL